MQSFTCLIYCLLTVAPPPLGCVRPSVRSQKFMKGRVMVGLLSSPLGSGMRPDLVSHHDGPLMEMNFNPFPPGGRNGSWHSRGETPRLIRIIWSVIFLLWRLRSLVMDLWYKLCQDTDLIQGSVYQLHSQHTSALQKCLDHFNLVTFCYNYKPQCILLPFCLIDKHKWLCNTLKWIHG